jgi:hypothetical protein
MGKAIDISHRTGFWFVLAYSSLLVVNASGGQESAERSGIGLCLAGGDARGGAHIGVLKVLEEMRVPVDCIAGTSIGSIVGGLVTRQKLMFLLRKLILHTAGIDDFDDLPISFRAVAASLEDGSMVVLVVDVTKPLDELERDLSLKGVIKQTMGLTIVINSMDSLGEMTASDLLLVPDLDGIGVKNFGLSDWSYLGWVFELGAGNF